MKRSTEAAWERTMKIQEVMLRAMAKRITWWQAAEIIGISCRQMRRWLRRYEEHGYEGLRDRRRGRGSEKRVPLAQVEAVLQLYQDQYFDFNVRHFHEKLVAEHGIKLSYTWVKLALQGAGLVQKGRKRGGHGKARARAWVKLALQGAGLVQKGRKRGVHRKRRPRRSLPGMLLHIDGSQHQWFCDHRWYDLIVIMDDATSKVYYEQLVAEESKRRE